MLLTSRDFADARQICERVARRAFERGTYFGLSLPVRPIPGQRGGAGGVVYGLDTDAACPDLRALLNLPSLPVEAPIERPVEAPRKPVGPVDAGGLKVMQDRLRVIAPILEHPRRSPERAAAFRNVALVPHVIGGSVERFSESTLRDWVRAVESRGDAALLPKARADKGRKRYLISKAWDDGIGLDDAAKAKIAARLEATAKGVIVQAGSATRTVLRVCSAELQRLSAEAGCTAPRAKLRTLCKLNWRWAEPFADRMRVVHAHGKDHKRYSDKHEARVSRRLADLPMDVVFGDVHHVDISVAPLADPVRVKLIAWLCAATLYLHVTPVLVNGRQSITQHDVARSLFDLTQSPWGGMPKTLYLDNGGEYGALEEAAARFAALAEGGAGLRIIKARPYSPESKGALEGAFGNLEQTFIRPLPGYIAGERMKSPTKSKGKPVDPYPYGEERLIEDILQAVHSYNGTPQGGRLGGLSPRAKLQDLIDATGWAADRPSPDMFDLVFSREERRDVRNGSVSIGGRFYSGDVLADLIGERQVPVLIPLRDPEGPAIIFRDEVIHRLYPESFGQTETAGARRQGELARLQRDQVAARRAGADLSVDVPGLLAGAADRDPVRVNPPTEWGLGVLDKTGRLGGPMTEEEAAAAEDARIAAELDDYLALGRAGKGRAISVGSADRSCAT